MSRSQTDGGLCANETASSRSVAVLRSSLRCCLMEAHIYRGTKVQLHPPPLPEPKVRMRNGIVKREREMDGWGEVVAPSDTAPDRSVS